MNKDKLMEMGINEELASNVMSLLDGNYIPKSRFNEVNTELKGLKEQIRERDAQLEALKQSNCDINELKKQIESLQADNLAKDEAHSKQLKEIKINSAIDKALLESKAKNTKAVKALLDLGKIELLEDGNLKGLESQIKNLMEDEKSNFMFDLDSGYKGFVPGQKKDGVPSASSEYQSRIMEARKNGNTLEAIKIKQEAADNGVFLA